MSYIIENTDIFYRNESGRVWRYGVAPVAMVLALAGRALLTPELHNEALFLYFVPPVLLSAGIGGIGPGLLATALSLAGAFFVTAGELDTPYFVNATAFTLTGIAVSWGGELLHRLHQPVGRLICSAVTAFASYSSP